jgi:hypothetical protein
MQMRKIYFFILFGFLVSLKTFGQVTVNVTNPTNSTPNLAASYTSLALAVTAVNGITAMSGPVTLTCAAGTETAPVGGYSITLVTATSATNTITFTTSGTVTLTAFTPQTSGILYDAIFKLIGADYITISGFTMQENAANTTTVSGTNNMTEWGVALLHASVTDGAQNNTIQNNIITLNKTYTNTFGIYCNNRHSATAIASTQDVTNNTTGPNSNNKVYGNTISNVNMGIAFIAGNVSANQDIGNDIGGSSVATGNTITNWGGTAAASGYISNSGTSYCIFSNNQTGDNISYNTITSASVTPAVAFVGIRKDYTASQPLGTFTNTISYNTITMTSAATSGTFNGILNQGMTALSTATVNITNNTILNMTMSGASSSSAITGILNSSAPGVLNLNNNAVRGCTSTATTGGFTGIQNTGAVVTTVNINNNQLGNGVTGPITFSVATSASIIGISNTNGAAAANISITSNTVDGIICVTAGSVSCISNTGGAGTNLTINSNSILNTVVSGATGSAITGITNSTAAASLTVNTNTIRGHSSASTTAGFTGIQNTGAVTGTININNNQVGNASGPAITMSSTTTASVWGISNTNGVPATNLNVTNNTMERFNVVSSFTVIGVINTGSPGGTINISDNSFGNATANFVTLSAAQNAAVSAVQNQQAGAGSTLSINNNNVDRISGISNISNTYIIYNSSSNPATININNNNLGSTTGSLVTYSAASTGSIYGIINLGSVGTLNTNYNKIDGISFVTSSTVLGIYNGGNVTTAINMENNALGSTTGNFITCSGVQTATIYGINNGGGASTTALSMQYNDITGINFAVTVSASAQLLTSGAAMLSHNVSNNTFTNLSMSSSGIVYLITKSGTMVAGTSSVINNNSIVGSFSKTASGGSVYGYISTPASVNGSTITITGNNFSDLTLAGSTSFLGIFDSEGTSAVNGPTKTITGNVFDNIASGSGSITVIFTDKGAATDCSSNTFSNITSAGSITGISIGTSNGQGNIDCTSNSFTTLSSSGGTITAIDANCPGVPLLKIGSSIINGLSSAGTGANITGINITSALAVNINDNLIHNVNGTGTGSVFATGIALFGGTAVNIYRNKVYDFQETGAGLGGPVINGIRITAGTTVNVYNNFVSDLRGTTISHIRGVSGIVISSATASTTYNLYYNSVYLNGTSSGANFGTAGIYHVDNATATTGALTMINNIVVNMTTPTGTARAVAYYINGTTLANYTATSDYNLFYAGTPGPQHVIFYDQTTFDQTLAAYQARVGSRDANSISLMPNFTSATDLHLTTFNCRINGRGTPVGSVTDDIDLNARNVTTPDIGADEFTATTSTTLAGVAGAPVCEDRTIAVTGTLYTSNVCDLIATILPSGADPVAGKVNACVTLDATQQYFNGEPYVQRHFDIEPTTSNQSTTSATITLYFTDAEFVLYNTTNPVWPQLPTSTLGNADPRRANVKVTQFHGVASTTPSSPGNYPGVRVLIDPLDANVFWNGMYWSVTFDVTGFSGFYVHSNNYNTPLPILVNYLNGHKQAGKHLLDWKVTCVSTPRAAMTLERSSDGRNYSGIYTITADAVRCSQPFDYTDADPLNGMNYYRLKIVDADGKITYSTTVALLNASKGFDIISIAPNPVVNDNFKLNVTSANASKMDISIFDMQGRLVNRQSVSLIAGFNNLPVNVSNLASGTYTIRGSVADEESRLIRFVKQ